MKVEVEEEEDDDDDEEDDDDFNLRSCDQFALILWLHSKEAKGRCSGILRAVEWGSSVKVGCTEVEKWGVACSLMNWSREILTSFLFFLMKLYIFPLMFIILIKI